MEKTNRTVKRALDILLLLRAKQRPMSCKEISLALDIPLTSTFDIVRTLHAEQFLEYRNEDSKAYVIGIRCFEIGSAYSNRINLLSVAQPYERLLAEKCKATSFVVGVDRNKIVYLDKIEAPSSVRTSAELGSRVDMYCSGLGKSILASYSEEQVTKIFNETNIVAHSQYTITELPRLLEDLAATRERGFAIDNREGNINVFCIAAPIRDRLGNVIAAISVAMLYSEEIEERVMEYGSLITSYALEISHKLGYIGKLYI